MMFLHLTSSSSSSSSSCTSRLLLSVIIIYSVYFSSVVLKVQCQDAYQDEKGNDFSGDDIDNEARRLQESKKEKSSSPPPLLVISLDGFRYDYLDRVEMKSLKKLSSNGVHATNGMKGIFSTITFPSHWTLATGLFEESHGIVANKFYDPIRRDTFNKSRTERFWWGGEPIWATAKKQGKKVGVYFWPGSNVDFGSNSKPDYWFDYNISVPLKTRTEAVTRWLTKEKIDLAMMYYHEPDKSGHGFGYMSDMVVKQLQDIDNHLVDLFDNLSKHSVNIIVLSDHGMVNETSNPETKLDESVEELSEHISWSDGVITHFWPKKGKKDKLLSVLRSTSEHYSVYEKEDIPKRWRYRNNPRIGDVITVADEGYFVSLPQKVCARIWIIISSSFFLLSLLTLTSCSVLSTNHVFHSFLSSTVLHSILSSRSSVYYVHPRKKSVCKIFLSYLFLSRER